VAPDTEPFEDLSSQKTGRQGERRFEVRFLLASGSAGIAEEARSLSEGVVPGLGGGLDEIHFRPSAGSTSPISPPAPARTPSPVGRRTYGERRTALPRGIGLSLPPESGSDQRRCRGPGNRGAAADPAEKATVGDEPYPCSSY
jgi:hypothetical protein